MVSDELLSCSVSPFSSNSVVLRRSFLDILSSLAISNNHSGNEKVFGHGICKDSNKSREIEPKCKRSPVEESNKTVSICSQRDLADGAWIVHNTARPREAILFSSSNIVSAVFESRPDVGSSRMSKSLSITISIAMDSLFR